MESEREFQSDVAEETKGDCIAGWMISGEKKCLFLILSSRGSLA